MYMDTCDTMSCMVVNTSHFLTQSIFPEMAEIVFNKCIQRQKNPQDNTLKVTFDYEFLDDFHKMPLEVDAQWVEHEFQMLMECEEKK